MPDKKAAAKQPAKKAAAKRASFAALAQSLEGLESRVTEKNYLDVEVAMDMVQARVDAIRDRVALIRKNYARKGPGV